LKILRFFKEGLPSLSIGFLMDNKVVDLIKTYYNFLMKKGIGEKKALELTMDLSRRSENFPMVWLELSKMINDLNKSEIPDEAIYEINEIKLKPPIGRPHKIFGVGLNYMDHAKETGREPPKKPMIFFKSPSAIIGPEDYIIIPNHLEQVDYEAELVVVIGKECKNVEVEFAMDCILGFTIGNDVSARDIQFGYKRHTLHSWAKSFDTFAPIGPWVVTKDEILDPHNLRIELKLNGEIMQSSNTKEMIFKVPYLVSFISKGITLEPGDLIFTGTPSGVGFARNPPRFLRSGDVIEIEIEKIGSLKNKVVREGELVEGW